MTPLPVSRTARSWSHPALALPALAACGTPARASPSRARHATGGKAKSTILFWLSGGASHIDTWDMKPDAPAEYPRRRSGRSRPRAPGVRLCEHLPHLARQAHHLAVVRSLGDHGRGTGDHHAGYYYNLTGHAPDPTFRPLLNDRTPLPDDWPFIGSVVALEAAAAPVPAARDHPAAQARSAAVHPARPVRRPARPRVRPGLRRTAPASGRSTSPSRP